MLKALWLSRPEVGSSKNNNNSGFAANSTPIVTRFLLQWVSERLQGKKIRL
jgi:hypothetical protein